MRILTIGPSPYLLASDGRIHRDIIISLTEAGHFIDALVVNHSVMYFLPSETGLHYFDLDGKRICQLFPFLGQKGEEPPFAFEAMKNSRPDVVITVGSYSDTDFIWSIKSIYPHLFKWVAVIPTGTDIINERHRLSLTYADAIITTTKLAEKAFNDAGLKATYIPYGPPSCVREPSDGLTTHFKVLSLAKNSQMSNVPAFLQALQLSGLNGTLHTNIDDSGDYDIRLLIDRYKLKEKISIPKKYVSIREGISSESMESMYREHDTVVDCSLQSATGLTMLEAMAYGCIPVGVAFGAVGEILELMPDDFCFKTNYETFVGPHEETLAVIDTKELAASLRYIERQRADIYWYKSAKETAVRVSKIFYKDYFTLKLKDVVELTVASENRLAVDSY